MLAIAYALKKWKDYLLGASNTAADSISCLECRIEVSTSWGTDYRKDSTVQFADRLPPSFCHGRLWKHDRILIPGSKICKIINQHHSDVLHGYCVMTWLQGLYSSRVWNCWLLSLFNLAIFVNGSNLILVQRDDYLNPFHSPRASGNLLEFIGFWNFRKLEQWS